MKSWTFGIVILALLFVLPSSGFRNSQFQFRPPALLANPGFRNFRFHFRPPALLANPGFRDSQFHFRPPALFANPGFRDSQFQFRPPVAVLPLQTRYTLANSQIPKSNPGPKAPKAKRFRIPRVQRLKLHFPPCNHAQPKYCTGTAGSGRLRACGCSCGC